MMVLPPSHRLCDRDGFSVCGDLEGCGPQAQAASQLGPGEALPPDHHDVHAAALRSGHGAEPAGGVPIGGKAQLSGEIGGGEGNAVREPGSLLLAGAFDGL